MIIGTRVDHRLVHGQVAFSWISAIGANCILVANDAAANNDMQMTALKLAAPQGVKVVVKTIADSVKQINSGVTDKYRLFIVLKTVNDAYQLLNGCPRIKELNVGGTSKTAGSVQITASVFLNDKDISDLKQLAQKNIEIFAQMVPTDKKIDLIKRL